MPGAAPYLPESGFRYRHLPPAHQHQAAATLSIAHVWALPAVIQTIFFLPATSSGTEEPLSVPSCPRRLLPQQYARLSVLIAQVCNAPAVMEVNMESSATGTGLGDMAMVLLVPSCPSALLPLHNVVTRIGRGRLTIREEPVAAVAPIARPVRSACLSSQNHTTDMQTCVLSGSCRHMKPLMYLPAIYHSRAVCDSASVLVARSERGKSEAPHHWHRDGRTSCVAA